MKVIPDRVLALRDKARLRRDTSPEAAAGIVRHDVEQCGFTPEDLKAAAQVTPVELDEDD